ncbi:hypothetical protein MuYL_3168 [Mucilaginibacter xinganensis]|uniref:Uncharacterized protein n=1 Tax=Mucilaginibacter xinganensis TaxID=1234841 RepID=A0A223NYW7_9SPHI|nr:hypothetical protein MuYL_3168 [Mucilaginibacter xinganensis]
MISLEINAQDCNGTNKREKKVLKLINSLPEILIENQFRKSAHSATFLKAYIQKIPTNTDHNYYVSISEEKGERLFTYDWYKVNSGTYVISYYDMINNKTMSLKEWRMHNKQLSKHKTLS